MVTPAMLAPGSETGSAPGPASGELIGGLVLTAVGIAISSASFSTLASLAA
jgi:hypothetical protein